MKATPELLELALRGIGIGTNLETCSKILTTVRLLEVKGDSMDLKDLACIEAKGLDSGVQAIDMSNLEINDLIEFANGESHIINSIVDVELVATNEIILRLFFRDNQYGCFHLDGRCESLSRIFTKEDIATAKLSDYDIIKITKPTKPQ